MRDSQIGTYGGAALILSIGLRWVALVSLAPVLGILALLIAHSGSRAAITIAMQFSVYARTSGLGKLASGELPEMHFMLVILTAFALALLLGFWQGMLALSVALLLAWAFLKYVEYRIGGYTGDVFGAMQQIAEITILIMLAGFWA